jgi:hypothetical protein
VSNTTINGSMFKNLNLSRTMSCGLFQFRMCYENKKREIFGRHPWKEDLPF